MSLLFENILSLKIEKYYVEGPATNCPTKEQIINTETECRAAAAELGNNFRKVVAMQTDRPAGCFWDRNAQNHYFNTLLDLSQANPTFGGVRGTCKKAGN